MKRASVSVMIGVFGVIFLTQTVAASNHFTIICPLAEKEASDVYDIDLNKNIAFVDVTASAPVPFDVVVYPSWTTPTVLPNLLLDDNYFGSSLSVEQNLFSYSGAECALVLVQVTGVLSAATLNILSGKDALTMEIPNVVVTSGRSFVFAFGDPGESSKIYVGNPGGTPAMVEITYGPPTSPVAEVLFLQSLDSVAAPIETEYSRLTIRSDVPIIAILEVVYGKGKIVRTHLLPS